jgi:CO/xanthine dehydrogenase Mo-binding subunit
MKNPVYRKIQRDIPRIGAAERLGGRAAYAADLSLDGALVLRAFRSAKSHARILHVDIKKALRLEGVEAVFTEKDIPGTNLVGIIVKDQPLLATEKVRFVGEPIAVVAARNETQAQKALDLIEVKYEELPAVFDPDEALFEWAPRVHEKGNLLLRRTVRRGDVDAGFDRSHVVVESPYATPHLEHAYLESDAGAGYVDEDGTFVIYASTQNPHYDQKDVAGLLGLQKDHVRIVQSATGGGFGSKLDLTVQGFIGVALYHLRRPVKMVYSREEAFLATAKRHPLKIRMKTGVDDQGRLVAMQARIVCDTGAYCSYGLAVAARAAVHATGPYEVENVHVESLCVYTNNPVSGAMRGFGVPQMAFAHESQMDLLARRLSMDPFEIRRGNAFKSGSITATGQQLNHSVGISDTLKAIEPHYVQAKKGWKNGAPGRYEKRGVGLAAMWYGIGNTGVQNPSSARIEMDLEGRVTLYTGAADIGQGSSTVLAQIAAEVLGIEPEDIRMLVADTRFTSNAGATSASRQTYISGNAVKDASEKLTEVLLTEAVDVLKSPKSFLLLESGQVVDGRDHSRKVPFAKLARRILAKGIPLGWQGFFDPKTTPLDPETGQGIPYATYAFACQMALVKVDVLTGEVRAEKIVAAHDVGRAIHPQAVKGQIYGGVAMGLGFALMEEFHPGKTRSMKDYHIPTCADMPEVVPIIVEDPEPTGPFGAKGVGEPALIPTAPAVLNAIADALGERIYRLPANLERVLEAGIKSGLFGHREV